MEWVHKAIANKVDILVFHCLLRNTLGFWRSQTKISVTYISNWTGVAVPNVRKSLKALREQGFVVRLQAGTLSYDAAIYELPIVRAILTPPPPESQPAPESALFFQATGGGQQRGI